MADAMVAWLFPGQGSQEAGMGRDLYENHPVARSLYDGADQILGRSLTNLCFDGPEDELNKTTNAQPAIYVTSLACLAAARETSALTEDPSFVAGHSLGEYSALAAASALDFAAGLQLVETRGRLTQAAADASPGIMAAVLGLDEAAVQAVCDERGAELCNINSPGQIVIGGSREAVNEACKLAVERGARRAMPLNVGGAFHTSHMTPAVEDMVKAVEEAAIRAPLFPIVANNTGRPLSDADAIGAELTYQLTHPVRWIQCVEFMASKGVSEFIEIGPGKVLSGLVKRIAPEARLRSISGSSMLN